MWLYGPRCRQVPINPESLITIKQISEVEENPFMSSLNICPERGWGGRSDTSPSHHHPISQLIRGYFIQRRCNRYSPSQCFLPVNIWPFLALSSWSLGQTKPAKPNLTSLECLAGIKGDVLK